MTAALATFTSVTQAAPPAGLKGMDVGSPSMPGTHTVAGDQITVVGGGSDIWNASDNFYYAYFPVTGDFDYVVKVENLIGNVGDGGWSKAELMARLPLDASADPAGDDPHISNMANRPASDIPPTVDDVVGVAGVNNRGPQWRSHRAGEGQDPEGNDWTGVSSWTTPNPAYPPQPPNQWLRLERVGSVFYMYTSNDGSSWNMYNPFSPQGWDTAGSWPAGADNPTQAYFTNAWPAKINLGLAVTAHTDSYLSTGVFSGFQAYTPVPIAITAQPPATLAVTETSALNITVVATGDPVHYQWSKNGTVIPQAVADTYSVAISQKSDAGTYTVKVFGGGKEIMSSATVVTVTTDTTPPVLLTAAADGTFTRVTVNFDGPMGASATNAANYAISPSVAVTAVTPVFITGSTLFSSVILTTAKQAQTTLYTLTASNVKDSVGNSIVPPATATFTSAGELKGYAFYQRWDDGSGDEGDLPTFAGSIIDGTIRPADVTSTVGQFGCPWGATDNYNASVQTFFTPPTSGNYVFFVSSDDSSNLYLSTDETPANKKLIANEGGWSNQYQWTTPGSGDASSKRSDQYADTQWPNGNTITLQAGKKYYMEINVNEGGGGDGADATYIMEGAADPTQDAAGMLLKGDVIAWYESIDNLSPIITTSPVASTTIPAGGSATFTVAANGAQPLSYQWQLNGVAIPGATATSYTIANATPANNGQYQAVVTNPKGSATSTLGKVMVTATGVFAIEAEDFNYAGGQTMAEASVMPYYGGAYTNLGATFDVDYHNTDVPTDSTIDGHPVYRYNASGAGDLETDAQAVSIGTNMDGQWGSTRSGEWTMTSNYKIGWVASGDWGNYTRTFPTPAKTYQVYAAQSYDGLAAGQLNGALGVVTSSANTTTQTVDPIGVFTCNGSGGWSQNNLFPMTDAAGAIKTVELGGTTTLRWTYNSGDADYLMFIPVSGGGDKPMLSLSGSVITYTGTLTASETVAGTYAPVAGATSPYTMPKTGTTMYYRSQQ